MKKLLIALLLLCVHCAAQAEPARPSYFVNEALDLELVKNPFDFSGAGLVSDVVADVTMPIVVTLSPINLSMIASRTSGVSPFGVVFTAVGTTSTATTKPFHEIEYRWNFGDPNVTAAGSCGTAVVAGEGFWRCGSNPGVNSKNTDRSPISGHIFEITEGTGNKNFLVTVTAFDGTNTATGVLTITATDPAIVFAGALTICVGNALPVAGVGGCRANASVLQASGAGAFNTAVASCTTGKRCLFNGGDTFPSSVTANISQAGPITLGSYGTGLPLVTSTNIGGVINLTSSNVNDLRVMDFDIAGNGAGDTGNCLVFGASALSGVTALRISCHDIGKGFTVSGSGVNRALGSVLQDNYFNNLTAVSGGNGFFGYYRLTAIIGNSVGPNAAAAEHNVRCQPCQETEISYNLMTNPGTGGKSCLTIRAIEHSPDSIDTTFYAAPDTQYVHVGDNKFVGNASNGSLTDTAPASNTQNNWIYDVIYERNWLVFGSGTQVGYQITASKVTVRNNVCDSSLGPTGATGRNCYQNGYANTKGAPIPDDDEFYNNVSYDSATGSSNFSIKIGATTGTTNNVVKNNLAFAPNATSPQVVLVQNGSTITGASGTFGNSSNAQMLTDPKFTCPTGCANVGAFTPANAKPLVGSYAIGNGSTAPVWSDFFLAAEPSPYDSGAVVH